MALVKIKTTSTGGLNDFDLPMLVMLVLSLVVMLATAFLSYRRYRMQMEIIRAMIEATRPEPQQPNIFAHVMPPLFRFTVRKDLEYSGGDEEQFVPVSCELISCKKSEYSDHGLSRDRARKDHYYAVNYLIVFPDSTTVMGEPEEENYKDDDEKGNNIIPPSISFATRLCRVDRDSSSLNDDDDDFDVERNNNKNPMRSISESREDGSAARLELARTRALQYLQNQSMGITQRVRRYFSNGTNTTAAATQQSASSSTPRNNNEHNHGSNSLALERIRD